MEKGLGRKHLAQALRQKKYTQNNPEMAKLSQTRKRVALTKKRRSDPEFDTAFKKKIAEKKREQRLRKKSGIRENELVPQGELSLYLGGDVDDIIDILYEGELNVIEEPSVSEEDDREIENSPPGRPRSLLSQILSRREKGEQVRRRNRDVKNRELFELKKELDETKKLVMEKDDMLSQMDAQLERQRRKYAKEYKNNENSDNWVRTVYSKLSSDGKRQFREAFLTAAPEMERGTVSRLRKTAGLNFSIPPANSEQVKSDTKLKIEKFARDNTIDVPDKKKVSRNIRYRTSSLLSLFESFDSQHPNLCTYETFCKYWPKECVKPKPSDLGTCLCIICQNAELKAEALKHHIGAEHSLETILENARGNDFAPELAFKEDLEKIIENEDKKVVGFSRWEKVKQVDTNKNTGRAKSDKIMRQSKTESLHKLAESMLIEYDELKKHLQRNSTLKREIKALVTESEEDDSLAVVHVDWAEQHQLSEVKEVQSAYFAGRFHYEIHTAFVYSKEDNHGAASISTTPDHRAEAVNAAIKSKFEELAAKGKTKIVVVSDSPTSQYRNGKNVFLMRRLAVQLGITIRLIFTECGHGKSPCDGVGGNIKTQVESALLKRHGEKEMRSIHSAEDVKDLIENETNLTYDIKVHTADQIQAVRDSLPSLGPLARAMKIHEIYITADGVVKSKNLPTDLYYDNVKITESRRYKRVETVE